MGTYCYTFRAKTTNIQLQDGSTVAAHHMAYAFKYWMCSNPKAEVREENLKVLAKKAFDNKKSNYMVMTDDGTPCDGAIVYKDLKDPVWDDCFELKATKVGFAKKVGRKWTVVDKYSDTTHKSTTLDKETGLWLPLATISKIVDGKLVEERFYFDFSAQKYITLDEAIAIAREEKAKKEHQAEKQEWERYESQRERLLPAFQD